MICPPPPPPIVQLGSENESSTEGVGFAGVTTPTQQASPALTSFEERRREAGPPPDHDDDDNQHMLVSITAEMGVSPVMAGEGLDGIDADPLTTDNEGVGLPQNEADKYVCPTCSKTFDRPYRLQRHLQIHNPNRPKVNCHLCDKSFTRVDTLENHMKCLHSSDRPFKCSFAGCPKRFPLQSALIHHLKVGVRNG